MVTKGDINDVFDQLNGKELSYNNLLDIDAAVSLITDVSEKSKSTFAILKHNNACGYFLFIFSCYHFSACYCYL